MKVAGTHPRNNVSKPNLQPSIRWKALDEIYQIYIVMRPLGEKNRNWKWAFAPLRPQKNQQMFGTTSDDFHNIDFEKDRQHVTSFVAIIAETWRNFVRMSESISRKSMNFY